jgi:hypothetical protein
MSSRKPTHQGQQPRHGVIRVSTLKPEHARQHLATITASMAEVKDYGSHGTGFSSQGGFQQGGAAGADYETTNTGNTGDADSGGASDY